MRKLDERHQQKKQSPWIKSKERLVASPSKHPPPSYCPKPFLKDIQTPISLNDDVDIHDISDIPNNGNIIPDVGANVMRTQISLLMLMTLYSSNIEVFLTLINIMIIVN